MSNHDEPAPVQPPRTPIAAITEPISRFLHIEAASGVVLLICTLVALIAANSSFSDAYLGFWQTEIGFTFGEFEFRHSLQHLINDGLMVVFFFVIGLEVKREIVFGELRDIRRAALPLAAAFGGMVAPALIYLAIAHNGPGQRGWGIPMATDIAFVVGCMAILGPRVPHGLRIMMLTLAIADDIGAILVIAIGYSHGLHVTWLVLGILGILSVSVLTRLGVRSFPVYMICGLCIWFAFHESGIHATIAGVILGLMTPARAHLSESAFANMLRRAEYVFEGDKFSTLEHRGEKVRQFQHMARETISPLEYLETTLHPWSSFVVMSIFALANAGVPIEAQALATPVALAAMFGLMLGKPLGILGSSWLVVKSGMAKLPDGVNWQVMAAAGCLAGIGFTMALFVAELALDDELLVTAKIGVLAGSALSAALGMGLLMRLLPKTGSAASTAADGH